MAKKKFAPNAKVTAKKKVVTPTDAEMEEMADAYTKALVKNLNRDSVGQNEDAAKKESFNRTSADSPRPHSSPNMNQLWLRLIVADPETGTVRYRLPKQPLPRHLHFSQIRSYLEQRFGPPVGEHIRGNAWMEFANPDAAPEASGTRLLAIPLVVDQRTREFVPVFEKLAQLSDIAATIGYEGPDASATGRPWIGPLFDHASLLQEINDSAAQTMRASLLADGLMFKVDSILDKETEDPTPTEALFRTFAELGEAVGVCVELAEEAIGIHNEAIRVTASLEESQSASDIERLHTVERRFSDQRYRAHLAAQESERLTRDLAQLAFGLSACSDKPEAEIVDRASVAVLHPPKGSGVAVPLREDGLRLRAASSKELSIDLAGVICRILVDRWTRVTLRLKERPDCGVDLEVEPGDTLLISVKTPAKTKAADLLEPDAWGESGHGVFTRRWPSPVTAIVPARLISKTLFGFFKLDSVAELTVSVAGVDYSGQPVPSETGPREVM